MARKERRGAGRCGGADAEEETAAAVHRVLARCDTAAVDETTVALHQGTQDRSSAGRGAAAGSATPGVDCGGMRRVAARRRLAGQQGCTRPFSGSSSSTKGRPWEVWGKACSLVCLGLLSDQAASFQVRHSPTRVLAVREPSMLARRFTLASRACSSCLQQQFLGGPSLPSFHISAVCAGR